MLSILPFHHKKARCSVLRFSVGWPFTFIVLVVFAMFSSEGISGNTASTFTTSQLTENALAHNYLSHDQLSQWKQLEKARASCTGEGQDCEKIQQKLSALYRLDQARDQALQNCQGSGSQECLKQVAQVYDAFKSYANPPQLSSAYVKVATQYGQAKQRYMQDIGKEALINIFKDTIEGPVDLAHLAYQAYGGDAAAQAQLHAMGQEIAAFARSPVNHVSESMRARLALADKLESRGRTRDADLVRMELYLSSELTALGGVTGVAKLPAALGKGVFKASEKGFEGVTKGGGKAIQIDDLLKAGQKTDKNGLTKAGRALQKHGDRDGSVFPKSTGNPVSRNQQGQDILEGILKSENKSVEINRFGGKDIFDKDTGRGVRFNADGSMKGFLEPPHE